MRKKEKATVVLVSLATTIAFRCLMMLFGK